MFSMDVRTALIRLHSINSLDFRMETEGVYGAARTPSLNTHEQVNFRL